MKSLRIALVTSLSTAQGAADDVILFQKLAQMGHTPEFAVWSDDKMDWEAFDRIFLRSTWDYQHRWNEFQHWFGRLPQSRVINPAAVLEWNHCKSYLQELVSAGHAVVPTWFVKSDEHVVSALHRAFAFSPASAPNPVESKGAGVVLKPAISASSGHTFRVFEMSEALGRAREILCLGELMIQPYLKSIETEGEVSVVLVRNGADYKVTHSAIKVPRKGDFRVQGEFGGSVMATSKYPGLESLAVKAMNSVPGRPFYGRVDFVQPQSDPLIIEVELIEPDLYFRCAPTATDAFAQLIEQDTLSSKPTRL